MVGPRPVDVRKSRVDEPRTFGGRAAREEVGEGCAHRRRIAALLRVMMHVPESRRIAVGLMLQTKEPGLVPGLLHPFGEMHGMGEELPSAVAEAHEPVLVGVEPGHHPRPARRGASPPRADERALQGQSGGRALPRRRHRI